MTCRERVGAATLRAGDEAPAGKFTRRFVRTAVLPALACLLAFSCTACGRSGAFEHSWESDPIVPGYSVADINIGDPFSAVQEVHGDPDEHRKDGGYLYAYYVRTREEGNIDDPAAWRLVVTLYDQGNGYLDPGDEVGAVEVSSPYRGVTSGGVGIGSTPQQVEEEFGACRNVSSTASPGGGELLLYPYTERGVEFLISPQEGVVTVVVTAYGGLRPVQEGEEGDEGQGGLFGTHQADPIVPGKSAAGIGVGDEFRAVRRIYGSPDNAGSTTEGLVYATYTGGYGSWKLTLYLEDKDQNDSLGDFDVVVSICLRYPYAGKTPKGVGIGSLQADVLKEFGTPQRQSTAMHQGEQTTIMEYNKAGIVFALKTTTGEVIEIDVNRPLP